MYMYVHNNYIVVCWVWIPSLPLQLCSVLYTCTFMYTCTVVTQYNDNQALGKEGNTAQHDNNMVIWLVHVNMKGPKICGAKN